MESKLVLLDLDRTLLSCNSATLWIRRERRMGFVSNWQLCETIYWLTLYHLGKTDVRSFLRKAASWVTGDLESDIIQRTTDFWEESIRQCIRPEVHDMLKYHREKGHVLALLTASSGYLSSLVAAELDIEHVLCNQMEAVDGVLTGNMIEPLCFGAGKIEHAERLGKQLEMDWREGYFYTDSYSDFPVLDAVKYPKVVCPDQRLDRIARQRGWEILQWSG